MYFFAFSVGSMTSLGFLAAEGEAIFMLYRMWATIGLLNESKINCTLVKEDRDRDKACNGIDISVSVLVELTGLAMYIESLINSEG
jgi:hypothetical protein